jgi:hypothetical protein
MPGRNTLKRKGEKKEEEEKKIYIYIYVLPRSSLLW